MHSGGRRTGAQRGGAPTNNVNSLRHGIFSAKVLGSEASRWEQIPTDPATVLDTATRINFLQINRALALQQARR